MKRPATRVADLLNPAAALSPAANVIMQLSLPGVGYGVLESPVDSGNVYKHPFKRARTTGTYLAVATIGTETDRLLIRAAVDGAHRQVRSTSSSPVSYNAFDPKLQLWVAACLYRYFVEQHEFLYGPLDDEAADAVYRDGMRLGTTLQVPERMWPADRMAFDEYWKRSLDELSIDPPVREHLRGGGLVGLPAMAVANVGGSVQPVRDDGLFGARVPGADAAGLVGGSAAPLRVAAGRLKARRPADSASGLDSGLSAVLAGHALSRATGQADRLNGPS